MSESEEKTQVLENPTSKAEIKKISRSLKAPHVSLLLVTTWITSPVRGYCCELVWMAAMADYAD